MVATSLRLRPYQREAVEQCVPLLRAGRSPILTLPTGAGKTFTAVQVIAAIGVRTLVLAHRRELVMQAYERLLKDGADAGVIMAGHHAAPDAPVQVASIQTLARRTIPSDLGLVVPDECHHAVSPAYKRLREETAGVPWLGLTATPWRLDGHGLGSAGFTDIVSPTTVEALCGDGTLVRPTVLAPRAPDLEGVHTVAGEYRPDELRLKMSGSVIVGDIVRHWRREADGARTVAFAVDVAHSLEIRDRFRAAGIPAEHLDADTPHELRSALLRRVACGQVKVVCNVAVWTEGVDIPELECAIQARPTQSSCLHRQQIGRVMRRAQGKRGAVVLDHSGNFHRHGLVEWPVEFSLDGVTRVRVSAEAPCIACGVVMPRAQIECPRCGMLQRTPADFLGRGRPKEIDGELVHVNLSQREAEERASRGPDLSTFEEQAAAWRKFYFMAKQRNLPWLANKMFHDKFGYWPDAIDARLVDPRAPAAEDLDLLRVRWTETARKKGLNVEHFTGKCERAFFARATSYASKGA